MGTIFSSIANAIGTLILFIAFASIGAFTIVGVAYAIFEKLKQKDDTIRIPVSEGIEVEYHPDSDPKKIRKALFHAILTANAANASSSKDGSFDIDKLIENFRKVQYREDEIENYKKKVHKIEELFQNSPDPNEGKERS